LATRENTKSERNPAVVLGHSAHRSEWLLAATRCGLILPVNGLICEELSEGSSYWVEKAYLRTEDIDRNSVAFSRAIGDSPMVALSKFHKYSFRVKTGNYEEIPILDNALDHA
jgi:hypothetical protein